MAEVTRITVAKAREQVLSGKALFVCAYESEAMCSRNRLEGSLLRSEFEAKLPALSKDQEIILYCA
jgi:hypothetical protein